MERGIVMNWEPDRFTYHLHGWTNGLHGPWTLCGRDASGFHHRFNAGDVVPLKHLEAIPRAHLCEQCGRYAR